MKILKYLVILVTILVFSCSKDDTPTPIIEKEIEEIIEEEEIEINKEKALVGFNVRWRNTPNISAKLLKYVDSLKPNLMRYPGGTIAHKWNWREGLPNSYNNNDYVHKIEDLKIVTEATNSEIIFVLDVVHGTIEDQIEMIHQADVPVNYIELGNELYADDYVSIFPNGKTYTILINSWVPILREEFPNAKIGVSMIGRSAGAEYKKSWNTQIYENITAPIDAFIYHIYVGETETVQERVDRFLAMFIKNTGKELWITEYGAHSHTISQINELADYVESVADIALSHCLISGSGNFSKITKDIEFTPEGLAYLKRNNPLVN